MNPEADYELIATRVLARCAANDPWFPNPSQTLILGWADQFRDTHLGYQDLLAGVKGAYNENGSGFKPLPADIIRFARAAIRERRARETPEERRRREDEQDRILESRIGEPAEPQALQAPKVPMPPELLEQLRSWRDARKLA